MPSSAYRITLPITAAVHEGTHEILQTLHPGGIIIPASPANHVGMIDATCDDIPVRVFMRDLEERAEPVEVEAPAGR